MQLEPVLRWVKVETLLDVYQVDRQLLTIVGKNPGLRPILGAHEAPEMSIWLNDIVLHYSLRPVLSVTREYLPP
jgi:hypothetical protein